MTNFYIIETGNVIGVRLRQWNDSEGQYTPDCFADMVSAGRFYYNGLGHEVTEKQFIDIISFFQQEVTDINNGIDCPDTFGYAKKNYKTNTWRLDIEFLYTVSEHDKELIDHEREGRQK